MPLAEIARHAAGQVFAAFAASAEMHSDRVAIATPEKSHAYRELAAEAARIHGLLASHGLARGQGVGVMVGEPFALIATMLGVLRAGGYYVVLDADFPVERLRQIAADGVFTMILADAERSSLAASLAPDGMEVVTDAEPRMTREDLPGPVQVESHALAYVAYTSGSTGMPKGVMHPQANVLREAAMHRASLNLEPNDRSTMLYSPAVTGSVRDVFGMLLAGARICAFPFKERGFTELKDWLRAQGVTQVHAVPSIFRELVRAMEPDERLESVRVVYVAGASVSPGDVLQFRRHFSPAARFYTGIGATETSSIYTHWFVDDDGPWPQGRLPSGWPLADVQVRLVGDDRQELPPGQPGEIAVRGAYLADGYWQRPALSAAAFADAGDGSGRRIYYTGDYGCFDTAGMLVHLGRRDQQVKINGQRIELGEIEQVLCNQPGMRAAVVRVFQETAEKPLIAAYVVAAPTGFDEDALRVQLSRQLLSAAIPAVFVRLDALPLTSTGKIDYQALPDPRRASSTQAPDDATEQWTPDERRVLEVWREIFPGLASYHRGDSFARLGGDSLGAVRLVELLARRLGFESSASDFVLSTTIATLAARITASGGGVRAAEDADTDMRELSALATSWKLADVGREVAPDCPVYVAGEGRAGTPLVWFGQRTTGLEIGLAISERRPVFLVPSASAPDAATMDRICRRLAERLGPHLPPVVLCGGCCYSGLQATLLARGLREGGREVAALILVDAFGSNRARWMHFQVFRLQARLQRLRQVPLWALIRRDAAEAVRRLRRRANRATRSVEAARFVEGAPYRINFVPFGYDGPITHILSGNAAWLRWALPGLGWGVRENARAERHIIPGDHLDLLSPPAMHQVGRIIERVAQRADGEARVLETVSDTARWVAVYRAWETHQPDAIFRDPLAERLAGEGGERIVERLGASWMACSITVRTAAIDDFIRTAIAEGVDTVVNLAAGLDTRPYRMDLPPSLHWIEVDLGPITAYKEGKLASETPRCRLTREVCDLANGALRRALFAKIAKGARKVLLVTEGLLVYFPEQDVVELANDLAARPEFAYWALDFVSPHILESLNRNWREQLDRASAPMLFGPRDGAEFFRPHGWTPKDVRYFTDETKRLGLDKRLGGLRGDAASRAPSAAADSFGKWPGYVLLEAPTP